MHKIVHYRMNKKINKNKEIIVKIHLKLRRMNKN
jgi:hypothetical protein